MGRNSISAKPRTFKAFAILFSFLVLTLLFPLSFYSPTVHGASFIFNDGFEDGDFSGWDGTVGSPTVVSSPTPKYGTYASSSNTNGYYSYEQFTAEDNVFVKLWVQTDTLPPTNGYVTYFELWDSSSVIASLQLRRTSGGDLYHRIRYYYPSETTSDNVTSYAVDTWISVQIEFLDDASGYYKVWIDDVLTLSVTGVDTSGTAGASWIYAGRILSGFAPTIFIDQVTIDDEFITAQFDSETEYFYVDNNTSDVDSSADAGTHSSFSSQQSAPDQVNDTLTEYGSGGSGGVPVIEDYTEQSSDATTTTNVFLKPYPVEVDDLLLILAYNDDTSTTAYSSGSSSNFTFVGDYGDSNSDSHVGVFYRIATGSEGINEEITSAGADEYGGYYIRISGVDTTDPIHLAGSETNTEGVSTINATSIATTITDTLAICFGALDGGDGNDDGPFVISGSGWSRIDGFSSRDHATEICGVWGSKDMTGIEGATVDAKIDSDGTVDGMAGGQITITPLEAEPTDYELDLEEQWTGLEYGWDNEELCIFGGTWTTTVPLRVDAWDGDSWENVISDLQENQWNNVSVSSYLTEATFTIRFYNGSTNAIQDSWSKDSCLLHLWNGSELVAYIVDFSQAVSFSGSLDTDADYMIEFGQVGTFVFDYDTLLAMQLALSQNVVVSSDLDTDADYTNVFSQDVSPIFNLDTDTNYGIELVQALTAGFDVDVVHTLRTIIGYIVDLSVGVVSSFDLDTLAGFGVDLSQSISSVFNFDLIAGFGIDLSQSITTGFDYVTSWGSSVDLSQSLTTVFSLDTQAGYLANIVQGLSSSFGLATQTDYLIELSQSLTTGFNVDILHTLRTIIAFIVDLSVDVTGSFNLDTVAGFGIDLSQSITTGFDYVTSWGSTVLFSQAISFASSFTTQAGYLANIVQTISSSMGLVTQTDYLIELSQSLTTGFNVDILHTLRTIIAFIVDLSVDVTGSFSLDTLTGYNINLVQGITSTFNYDLLSSFTILLSQSVTSVFDLATGWGSTVLFSQAITFASSLDTQSGYLVTLVQGITSGFSLATQTDYLIELIQTVTTSFSVDVIRTLRTVIAFVVDLSASVTSVFGYSTLAGYGIDLSQGITSIFNMDTLAGFGIGLTQSITTGFDYVTSWGTTVLLSQAIILETSISLQSGFLISLVQGITGSFDLTTQTNYFITLVQTVTTGFTLDILFVARDALAYIVDMSVSVVSVYGFDTIAGFGIDLSQSITSVFNYITSWGINLDLSQGLSTVFNLDTLAGYNINLVQGISGSFGLDLLSRFTVVLSQTVTSSFEVVLGWASNIIILSLPISFVSGVSTQANYFASLVQTVSTGFGLDTIAGFGVGLTQVITTGFNYATNWGSSIDLSQGLSLVSGVVTQTNYSIELVLSVVSSFGFDVFESITAYFVVLSQVVTVSLTTTISSVWTVLPSLDLVFSWVTDVFQMRLQLFPTPFGQLGDIDDYYGYIIIACLVVAVAVMSLFLFKEQREGKGFVD